MGIKEVKPGDVSQDNILGKKNVRELGSVGFEDLVQKVQQKIEEKVQKISEHEGASSEITAKKEAAEAKKTYFNKVGVEKNMNTSSARAMRGNLTPTQNDPKNLKVIALPTIQTTAEPVKVATLGEKAHMAAPFQAGLGDVLGRVLSELQDKPKKALSRMEKMKEKTQKREKKFGQKVPPTDKDPNEFCEEEYERQKKSKKIIKMFGHLNKILGQKMDTTGAPPEEKSPDDDNDDE